MENTEIRFEGEESTTPTPVTEEGTVEGATEETAQDGDSPENSGDNN